MLTQENFSSVIDEVMHGAIDMHVHFGPDMPPTGDLGVARRLDGQAFGPVPAEAFRAFVGQLLFHGMSPEEVKTMAQSVPARILGLD